MPEPTNTGTRIYLIPIAGPPLEPLRIDARDGGMTLGRHAQCDLPLPIEAEMVSRFHVRFDRVGDQWRLTDLNSRWGTFLNGVRMTASQAMPLSEGDLVRINPWTFSVSRVLVRRGLEAAPDDHTTMIHTMLSEPGTRPREDIVGLLLEGAAAIHGAQTEQELAERLMDVAIRGTGLTNAILLRPLDARGRIEPIAMRTQADAEGGFRFSRSLIAAAAEGRVARIGAGGGAADVSQSIVEMRITAALCVPLMLGESPAALLYLDARGPFPATVRDDAAEFCVALGRIASLALANLKRMDIERRQAAMESELQAAAAAQKWVMPKRLSRVGPFQCVGESRAGQYVGGDFFDVIDLGQGRLGLALGDVSGKGVSASVLMTATQGFLHAALSHDADPGRAVTAVNNFVGPRRPENRFVTMWVGVFDSLRGTLRYVDAGHGYALQQNSDGSFVPLNAGDGPPVGIADGHQYTAETVILPPNAKVVVVSDGIVEQPAGSPDEEGRRPQFEVDGVQAALSTTRKGSDEIQTLFDAVIQHAGSERLADDATAVVVRRWGS